MTKYHLKDNDHFLNAAIYNETDKGSFISRIMVGRVINGEGAFDLLLNAEKLENIEYSKDETGEELHLNH